MSIWFGRLLSIGISMLLTYPTGLTGSVWAKRPPKSRTASQPVAVQKEIDLQPDDDIKVRRSRPAPAFDDKGKPRKHTAAELKELKGADSKLPGYNAVFEDLHPGQAVKVILSKKKDPPKSDTSADLSSAKTVWVPAGELTGSLTKVQGTTKKLTLKVQTLTYSGANHNQTSDKKKLSDALSDRKITTIIILADKP